MNKKFSKKIENLIIKTYIWCKKALCMINVFDDGVNALENKPYRHYPYTSLMIARQLLIMVEQYYNLSFKVSK